VAHPLVFYNNDNVNKSPSNTTSVLYSMGGGLYVSASKRPPSGHLLVDKSIKSKPYEMPAHYGIPCGFTRIVMDKNK
jgi:hypothetical protein